MEIVEIPITSSEPHSVQENEIFGETFFLEFEWIENEQFWLLHLFDADQNPLVSGVKLQPNWPFYAHQQGESGFILSLHQTVSGPILSRKNLNTHFVLVAHVPSV